MQSNKVSIVHRVYFRDGGRLYPENGYDIIKELNPRLLHGIFLVRKDLCTGLVDQHNNEIFPLQHCDISAQSEQIGDNVYTMIKNTISEFCYSYGILQFSFENGKWIAKVILSCKMKDIDNFYKASKDGWLRVVGLDGQSGYFNLFTHKYTSENPL